MLFFIFSLINFCVAGKEACDVLITTYVKHLKRLYNILVYNIRRGSGQVVSMLAFYSDSPSSNPAEVNSFSVEFVLANNENKQKDAGVGPLKKDISIQSI